MGTKPDDEPQKVAADMDAAEFAFTKVVMARREAERQQKASDAADLQRAVARHKGAKP